MRRNLKAWAFNDGRGRQFEVVALDFIEALAAAVAALRSQPVHCCPHYAGMSCSLPGVHDHPIRHIEAAFRLPAGRT